jgi:RNA polymerase sigma-70 factor (ECF subfamily)
MMYLRKGEKMTDSECIAKVLNGNVDAYRYLVQKYQGAVYGLAFRMVNNFADAEDLAQESFLRAYLDLHQLKDHRRFAGWLRQVTLNVCRMYLRQCKVNSVPLDMAMMTPSPARQLEMLEEKETLMQLEQAMEKLPQQSRTVLTLYYMDGLSLREIGDFIGATVSTVKGRLYKARRKLKGEMLKMVEMTFEKHKVRETFTQKVEAALSETLEILQQLSQAKEQGDMVHQTHPRDDAFKRLFTLAKRYDAAPHSGMDKDKLQRDIFDNVVKQNRQAAFQQALELIVTAVDANEVWRQTQAVVALDVLKMAEEEEPRKPDDINILFGFLIGSAYDDYFELKSSDWSCMSIGDNGLFEQIYRTDKKIPRKLLETGTKWREEQLNGLTTVIRETTVESDNETITTPAGKFERCMKLSTVVLDRRKEQEKTRYRQTLWLAPGVGIVKLASEYPDGKELTLDIELHNWSIPEPTEDYLPLTPGSVWRYEWFDKLFNARTAEVYRLIWQDSDDLYLSRARYTYGSYADSELAKFIIATEKTPMRKAAKVFVPTPTQRSEGILFFEDFENEQLNTEPSVWNYQGVERHGSVVKDPLNPYNKVFTPNAKGLSRGQCPQDGFYSVGDDSWSDYVVEWDWLVTTEEQQQTIAFRHRDIRHYYCFIRLGDWICFAVKSPPDEGGESVRKAGVWENIPNVWHRLQLRVEENRFTLKAKERNDETPFESIEPICRIDIAEWMEQDAAHFYAPDLRRTGLLKDEHKQREIYKNGGIAIADSGYVDNIYVSVLSLVNL